MGLIMFQIVMNVMFIVIQLNSLSKLSYIKHYVGYETRNDEPENMLIHLLFVMIVVLSWEKVSGEILQCLRVLLRVGTMDFFVSDVLQNQHLQKIDLSTE